MQCRWNCSQTLPTILVPKRTNRKHVSDFLPTYHFWQFWDITIYYSKTNFLPLLPLPKLFETLAGGSPGTYGMKVGTESLGYRVVKTV